MDEATSAGEPTATDHEDDGAGPGRAGEAAEDTEDTEAEDEDLLEGYQPV